MTARTTAVEIGTMSYQLPGVSEGDALVFTYDGPPYTCHQCRGYGIYDDEWCEGCGGDGIMHRVYPRTFSHYLKRHLLSEFTAAFNRIYEVTP